MLINCLRCNIEFKRKPCDMKKRNYCSNACRRNPIVTKNCGVCGNKFIVTIKRRFYCSWVCNGRAVGLDGNRRIRGKLNKYVCAHCGKPFTSYYKHRVFCSRECFGVGWRGRHSWQPTKDKNQAEIVSIFRELGFSVLETHEVKGGFPDIAISKGGLIAAIEIKNVRGSFTRLQRIWHQEWQGMKCVVTCKEECLSVSRQFNVILMQLHANNINLKQAS